MNKNYIITVFVIFVAVLAFNVYRNNGTVENQQVVNENFRNGEFPLNGETWRKVTLDEFGGLQFDFRVEPDGYTVVERSLVEEDDADLEKIYVLMLKKDYEDLVSSTEPREGPPATTMYIFKNVDNMFPLEWAQEHDLYSNINDDLVVSDIVVGGANAIRYATDGLYRANNVVVAHGGYMYLISGAYLEQNDRYQQDFSMFMNSIKFVETEQQLEGTIN